MHTGFGVMLGLARGSCSPLAFAHEVSLAAGRAARGWDLAAFQAFGQEYRFSRGFCSLGKRTAQRREARRIKGKGRREGGTGVRKGF